ncbi:MAG: hypothetical protein IJA85_11040 [Clostridia bacterium]|nr:hypothetical protein [Clostridia bacterium]
MSACEKQASDGTAENATQELQTEVEETLVTDGEFLFTIVRSDTAGEKMVEASRIIQRAVEASYGVKPTLATDWDGRDDFSERYEILVGKTNRSLSKLAASELGENSYIFLRDGKKIAIYGDNDIMITKGVQAFVDQYLQGDALPQIIREYGDCRAKAVDLSDPNRIYSTDTVIFSTNSMNLDSEYIVRNSAAANDFIRFADAAAEMVYLFDITNMVQPTITLYMSQEYRIEASDSENGPWIKIETKSVGGTETPVTISPLSLGYDSWIYVRLTDPTTEDGGGAAVGRITITSLREMSEQDLAEHAYYLDDETKEIIKNLSSDPQTVELEGYEIHEDGGLIYNPISDEQAADIGKYNGAEAFTGSIQLGDKTLTYSIPKLVTAYDAVPLTYTLTTESDIKESNPLHLSVTGQEDAERENGNLYYDLNFPGLVDIDFAYEGYVAGYKDDSKKPNLSLDFKSDRMAGEYPDYATSELRLSGTVEEADYIWFKFNYINSGNTVLDGDGNGTFCFEPFLYKKNGSSWEQYSTVSNMYYRIVDEVYPGESGTLWVTFQHQMPAGEYMLKINCEVRNEIDNPEIFGRTIWGGEVMSYSTMEFTVGGSEITEPKTIEKVTDDKVKRNAWIHYYEEFQSSYVSFLKQDAGSVTDTLYIQLSHWCNQVVIKLIDGNKDGFEAVSIPIQVESDSLSIILDEDHQNYVVLEDGTRFPVIMTQSMADMRVNITQSPDTAADITKYLCEMKDIGINVVNTTAGFAYDNVVGGPAFQHSVDVMRELGLKVEGFVSYPYLSSGNLAQAARILKSDITLSKPGISPIDIANAAMAEYQFMRWGDSYWVNGNTTVLSVEDTRGGSHYTEQDHTVRDTPIDNESIECFRIYLKSLYGTIDNLNEAWGSEYKNFYEITVGDVGGVPIDRFTAATIDYDIYCSYRRTVNYKTMLDEISDVIPGAKLDLRLEGSQWLAKIDPLSINMRDRHVLANQYQGALIPELLSHSETLYCFSNYCWDVFRPSEVGRMTKSALEDYGIVSSMLPLFNRMRPPVINSKYGKDFTNMYNITGENTKVVMINTTVSLYEWWKATYENGGIPGILWSDYLCDGYATATQRREIEFFINKLKATIDTPEGQKWATEFEHDENILIKSNGVYAYDSEFVKSQIKAYYKK